MPRLHNHFRPPAILAASRQIHFLEQLSLLNMSWCPWLWSRSDTVHGRDVPPAEDQQPNATGAAPAPTAQQEVTAAAQFLPQPSGPPTSLGPGPSPAPPMMPPWRQPQSLPPPPAAHAPAATAAATAAISSPAQTPPPPTPPPTALPPVSASADAQGWVPPSNVDLRPCDACEHYTYLRKGACCNSECVAHLQTISHFFMLYR